MATVLGRETYCYTCFGVLTTEVYRQALMDEL